MISVPTLCSFNRVNVGDAGLLGAPFYCLPVEYSTQLGPAAAQSCPELSTALICAQDALTRALLSAPRIHHFMCCSPSVDNSALADVDKLLRSATSHLSLTNSDLSDDQWLQASLPIKMGGLGLRKVSSLALPAYLASDVSTA